jgi:N-acetylmuramoyl-L-alanine amidase
MKKVAFVVGHHKYSKGAKSPYLDSEWDLMSKVANGLDYDVFWHNPNIGGYTGRQKAMAKMTADYDVVFELHYNAAHPVANGCEAVHWFANSEGKYISSRFCDLVNREFGITKRGAKPLHSKNQRGYGFLYHTKGTAIILEPFFGSNLSDTQRFSVCKYIDILNQLANEIKNP